jgi:MFS superfamily sulfate permease-like transporter
LVALFLTPLFYNLPEATLGAIVIVAVAAMMKFAKIRSFYALRRVDFWLAMVALFGVLTFEALEGLLIAVIVSLFALVARASKPKLSVMGREPDALAFSDVSRHPENRLVPGLVILRPEESIFFANAASLRDAVLRTVAAAEPAPDRVLLDLELCTDPDIPAADMLKDLNAELRAEGVTLALCRVHAETRGMLERCGAIEAIGEANIYPRMIAGVLAYLTEHERWAELRALLHDLLGGALWVVRLGKDSLEDQSLAEEIETLIEQSARNFDGD